MINNENKVLLISGTGGSYTIRGKDLECSLYDNNIREQLIDSYYIVDGKTIIPENMFYMEGSNLIPLLRHSRCYYPPLVTRTLEDILESNDIPYESIPCDTIWENRDYEEQKFKFVCLSTTFMWNEKMIERALKWIDDKIDYEYLLVGGHYSSVKFQLILDTYPNIDYLIVGDGETSLPLLIKKLIGSIDVSIDEIPNLAYKVDGNLIRTKMKYEDMNHIKKVKYDGEFDRLSYESVRGCAFGCKFCTWDAGIKCFRYKSADKIINDVKEYIEENKIKRIEINDSTFLFPFSRIEPILKGFTELGVHWKAHSRSDVPWNDEMLKKLDESRCDILQIGFESMCDRILKNMNKKTTAQMNRFTNEMLAKTMVDTVVSFMVGFPDEKVEEFNMTWNYILNEFIGHFYLFVFEMEDKSLDLWKERDKYGFELFEDKEDCVHGGSNWIHNGMTSEQAFELREKVLQSVRKNNSIAIYKSWQSPYEWPFIKNKSKLENLKIERLIDNLIFLPKDVSEESLSNEVRQIKRKLEEYGIIFVERA